MAKILRVIILVTIYLAPSIAVSQLVTKKNASPALKKALLKSDSQLRQKKYGKAIKGYNRLIAKNPNFIDAWINKGTTLYELKDWQGAIKHYKKAIELDPGYMARVHFTVGMILFKHEEYETSLDYFSSYVNHPKSTPPRKKVAKEHLEKASFRMKSMANPVSFDPIKLPGSINTSMSEFLPSLTAENVMVFSRKVGNQEDLYYTIMKNQEWQEALPISNLNTNENEAAHSISADGNWLVFTICNREESMGSCDLMISKWNGQKWSAPKNMGSPVNTLGWEGQPSLSAQGDYLIFASNRPGGYGDYDLWISYRKGDSWSSPQNLGSKINTKTKDETPFIHADGLTLYFSSNGHPGMGDQDLFISRRNEGNEWEEPINLGYPINTKNREGALSVSLDGSIAYFSTDRLSDHETQNLDIYSFVIPEQLRPQPVTYMKISLVDHQTGMAISGTVRITNLKSNTLQDSLFIQGKESPILCLPISKQFAFHALSEAYLPFTKHIDLGNAKDKVDPLILSIPMQKILTPVSEPVLLDNIFFETGSSVLLASSNPELEFLLNFLNTNSKVKIDILGHTDNTGSTEFNQVLSEDRAHAVYQYLIGNGIQKDRLTYTGYGSSKPVDSNDTATGRQKNRRTEFIIIHE